MSERYPDAPGHRANATGETSREAAKAFAPKAKPIRIRALEVFRAGPATAEQVAEALGIHWQIARARVSELGKAGLIEDSGARGVGALGGRVIVWRVTERGAQG